MRIKKENEQWAYCWVFLLDRTRGDMMFYLVLTFRRVRRLQSLKKASVNYLQQNRYSRAGIQLKSISNST